MWKGDSVSYSKLHAWVRRHLIKPELCIGCNKKPPHDVANISNKYKRELLDWEWLCRTCHMEKDGRLKALQKYNEKKKLPTKTCLYCKIAFRPKSSKSKYHSKSCSNRGRILYD